ALACAFKLRTLVVASHVLNLNASDSGLTLHHTVSLMYVGGRHIGFGTTLENKMAAFS
ncbi:hypothetical protein DPMN_138282, partial [Dreissena polymorpha]